MLVRLSFTNNICTTLGPTVDNMVGLSAFYSQIWYTCGYEYNKKSIN